MTTILVIILIILLVSSWPVYQRRADWGYAPGGIVGLLLIIILVVLILRLM